MYFPSKLSFPILPLFEGDKILIIDVVKFS